VLPPPVTTLGISGREAQLYRDEGAQSTYALVVIKTLRVSRFDVSTGLAMARTAKVLQIRVINCMIAGSIDRKEPSMKSCQLLLFEMAMMVHWPLYWL
jgi:hypothetical protein